MGRLFGTDGVRGVANETLTCEMAFDIGRAAAFTLLDDFNDHPDILIGKDTRISSDMLECALAAGICSVGANAVLLGPIPTPAVAYLVRLYGARAGFVISASHNPVEFNGIKVFNSQGFKLADEIEERVESYILENRHEIKLQTGAAIGTVKRRESAVDEYVAHIIESTQANLSGLRVVFDCANGAAAISAHKLFAALGAECIMTANAPDGVNINDGVGSTHLEHLRSEVEANGADIGIAFDGDADRCLAVDEKGGELDGDKIIAVFAKYLKAQGRLQGDTAVVTVMTNLGFMDFCKKYGIKSVRTAVGDRYVLEEMLRHGYNLGGEQSGHVILSDWSTTGDGQLTAALLLDILRRSGLPASELAAEVGHYPQIHINVRTTDEGKARFKKDEELEGYIEAAQQELFDSGRVLVRVSGTEPLIRIMVEGRDQEKIRDVAQDLESKVRERTS